MTGYGVFLTQKQLDAALDSSKGSPTKLIRCLVGVFFTAEVLATSSACGTRKHAALDSDIIQACIRKCDIIIVVCDFESHHSIVQTMSSKSIKSVRAH